MKEYTDNFLELDFDDANQVDDKVYSCFLFSDTRYYMFKRRAAQVLQGNIKNYSTPFLELETKEEANTVNLEVYSFLRFSISKQRYVFKRRRGY